MVKVALIQPGRAEFFAVQEPLNLGFIAGFLEKYDAKVTIIDELAGQNVKKELCKFSPDIAGITATTPLAPDAYRIAKMCREMEILTVMGGVHASVLPEEALQHVDIVVKGEGEIAMMDIIKGSVKSGAVSRHYIENLDEIPPPARHLMQMEFYLHAADRFPGTFLYFVPPHTKVASIITSRGCPYNCVFCHNTWRGIPYRFNSPERVISEIKHLIDVYDVGAIFFIEDNLFVNKPRLRKICKMMIENKFDIIWGGNARVDNIDLETLRITREAGCRQITFGFESGSQRILNVLNKRTTVEQNRRAIELCKKADILVNGTFMIGNPTETIEDVRATQQFIKENEIDSVGICITTPFPGTELWKWCEERGLIDDSFSWADFTFEKVAIPVCEAIPPEEVMRLYHETLELTVSAKPIPFTLFINWCFRHPIKTVKELIRYPKMVSRNVRRLKLKES